jgi:hypothetical protein
MKRILTPLALAAAAVVAVATPSAASAASGVATGPQSLPPLPPASAFGAGTVNPWFPVVPGTTTTFTGAIDGVAAREIYTVTADVKVVDGVPANVIHDRLYLARESGRGRYLAEDTLDWYATANNGDVWYLGEATTEYDEQGDVVSTDGSWQAGVGGARAGIFMPATPTVGATYQQESAVDAKDLFRITSVDADTLTTREWTPLEPGLVTKKVYESGTGQVLEDTVKGQAIEDLWLELVGRS